MTDITRLLDAARRGDKDAAGQAFALLYEDLRRLARSRLRQHRSLTLLDTTSVVHEAYLKVVGNATFAVADRHHFFAYAARVMRSVIVDYARASASERRGGDAEHVVLDTLIASEIEAPANDALRVHEALATLEKADPRLAQVAEMRYFGGLTEPQIAEALGTSERTVRRDWEKARLLLLAAME